MELLKAFGDATIGHDPDRLRHAAARFFYAKSARIQSPGGFMQSLQLRGLRAFFMQRCTAPCSPALFLYRVREYFSDLANIIYQKNNISHHQGGRNT